MKDPKTKPKTTKRLQAEIAARQSQMPVVTQVLPNIGHSAKENSDDKNGEGKKKSITASEMKKTSTQEKSPSSGNKYVPPSHLVKHKTKNSSTAEKIGLPASGATNQNGGTNSQNIAQRASKAPSHGTSYQNHTGMSTKTMNKFLKRNTQELMSSLSPEVRQAFETLYDRLDMSDSGGIDQKEVQELIKEYANVEMTMEEVQNVLENLDMKGTGDIEFDEFIFMLSQPENYIRLLDEDDVKKLVQETHDLNQKQRLMELAGYDHHTGVIKKHDREDPTNIFFRALREACEKDSMTALRTFYRNRLRKLNDHVIHDWSAGQRCIGLSDQEMLKRYETIQGELLRQRVNFCKDNSYRSSPYARPLEWGLLTLREGIEERRRKLNQEITKVQTERRAKISEFVCTPKAVPLPKYSIHKRHPLKKTFNYDQLADIRVKIDTIADSYYGDLKDIARENSKIIKKELAVEDIKAERSRQNFNCTFKAYCAPFVVSPWIPMPSPTLQASLAPLGKSKLAQTRKW